MPPYSVLGLEYYDPSFLNSGCGTVHVSVLAWNGGLENYVLTVLKYGYAAQASKAVQMTTINMQPYRLVGLEFVCVAIHVAGTNAAIAVTCMRALVRFGLYIQRYVIIAV